MPEIVLYILILMFILLFVLGGFLNLYLAQGCSTTVTALLKATESTRHSNALVFEYTYADKIYTGRVMVSLTSLTFGKARQYHVGNEYTVYINPKHPLFVKLVSGITIWSVLFSVLCILLGLILTGVLCEMI